MIDLDFVRSLIEALDGSSLDSLEIERGGTRVRLSKTPDGSVVQGAPPAPAASAPAPAPAPTSGPVEAGAPSESESPAADENLVEITSPMVGTFYRAPAPDAPAYVEVGDRIDAGDTLCIIEAMKLMNELEAEISGTIRKIEVENADPVEYGQVLFLVEPA